MSESGKALFIRYLWAGLVAAVACAGTVFLWDAAISRVPFLLFFAGTALAAWGGGVGPGLLVIATGLLTVGLLVHSSLLAMLLPLGLAVGALLVVLTNRRPRQMRALERNRVQDVQQSAGAGGWEWQPVTDAVTWSPSMWRLIGMEPPATPITLDRWMELIHPDDRDQFAARIREARHTGRYDDEYRIIHRDGNLRWVHSKGRLIRARVGQPQRIAGMAIDITARKIGEAERARLAALVESSDDAIVSKNLDGIITSWNRGAQRIFGYAAGEVIGKSILILLPPDRVNEEPVILAKLKRGERIDHFETERVTKDGRRIPVSLSVSPILDSRGRVIGASKIARDITERIRNEQALRDLNRTLEYRVAQRTRQLQALTLEVVQTEFRERRRLAQILHDHIQQLLAAAKMHASMVPESQREIRNNVLTLLDESIAACRSLTVELSPPILHDADLVTGLNWLARQVYDRHRLRVHISSGDLSSEPMSQQMMLLLFEAVRELLFNVVKHAHVDEAFLHVSESDGLVWVKVVDHGAGCEPGSLEQAGDRFGLFSVRERLLTVGGHFEMAGAVGQGCEVTVAVPRGGSGEDSQTMPLFGAAPAEAHSGLRVLLADDHSTMRKGLAGLLARQTGIHVIGEAGNGREAIALTRSLHPDVVVMDITMPDMNGIEATRAICSENPGVRVIGLSMHADPGMSVLMQQAGAETYLSKDGPIQQLLSAIRGEGTSANAE